MVETTSQTLTNCSKASSLNIDTMYFEASGREKKKRVYSLSSQASGLYPESFSDSATLAPSQPAASTIPQRLCLKWRA